MSWAEVFKINSNVTKPLNEQLRDMKYQPIRIITATGTFTPEKTGLYKVICVGAGGKGYANSGSTDGVSGGAGGVAIKTLRLLSTVSYDVTVSTTASFAYDGTAITATSGTKGTSSNNGGAGGTASGGDYNYPGGAGDDDGSSGVSATPGSVGVHLDGLSRSMSTWVTLSGNVCELRYGDNILGYGGGGNGVYISGSTSVSSTTEGLPAAVIIVPIEMEE